MKFSECHVEGARLISPAPVVDGRGRFMRAWCHQAFLDAGIKFNCVQANMAWSPRKGTMRGLHYQIEPALEAKLVRCTKGAIFDVVVDTRPDSPTYRAWYGAELSAENGCMLYVPEGCAHGCVSLADDTELYYMVSENYAPDFARGARYDDPAFAIDWPEPITCISEQDRNWPLL